MQKGRAKESLGVFFELTYAPAHIHIFTYPCLSEKHPRAHVAWHKHTLPLSVLKVICVSHHRDEGPLGGTGNPCALRVH